ncbi:TPA: hypothetical protein IAA82_05285 [Candidatus Galligastranaerophilus gallistercoris]|nr:hypothetical protein [Candidatus Galligastranaerophilus gallistercoris]
MKLSFSFGAYGICLGAYINNNAFTVITADRALNQIAFLELVFIFF